MRVIKLMPDYQCFPLWEASPGVVGNVDPNILPISDPLKKELMHWAQQYDETLNIDDPLSSGFSDPGAQTAFNHTGLELAEKLRSELGDEFEVVVHL